MDRYSVIVVGDGTSPVRRFDVQAKKVRQALWSAAIGAAMLVAGSVDYVNVRVQHFELDDLRLEVVQQREQIEAFESRIGEVKGKLQEIAEFERKVRIIANLPGSAGTGGEEVSEVVPEPTGIEDPTDLSARSLPFPIPEAAGAETDRDEQPVDPAEVGVRAAQRLGQQAQLREVSLSELTDSLLSKRERLAATPAIWPAKGWMTSRFGSRISPFTNRKQFHAGIDIAGERGTDVVASADGKVVFSGGRGPLGKSVIVDHGHGLRTTYGHTDAVFVKPGEKVERGQRIASLGSTGRSTGPHLHYVVEVNGKAVNPLDYIFD